MSRIFDKEGGDGLGDIIKKQETWYPTVRKMVWVLEQLHDFVKVGFPRTVPPIYELIKLTRTAGYLCRYSSRSNLVMPPIVVLRV